MTRKMLTIIAILTEALQDIQKGSTDPVVREIAEEALENARQTMRSTRIVMRDN